MAQEFSLEAPELVPGVLRILCARYSFLRLDSCAGKKDDIDNDGQSICETIKHPLI